MLFGYGVEPGFDLALEKRRDRMWWPLIGGTALCILYGFTGKPFATELFQGWIATSLFYGDSFYVRRGQDLSEPWLWKAFLVTVPFHALYLAGILWLDRAFPSWMTKVGIFLPVIAVGFAVESIALDPLIDRFKPTHSGKGRAQEEN
ncbi:MAG TPA: hypothetical protein VGD60_01035 [Candidatus Acidoferrales bacterium]